MSELSRRKHRSCQIFSHKTEVDQRNGSFKPNHTKRRLSSGNNVTTKTQGRSRSECSQKTTLNGKKKTYSTNTEYDEKGCDSQVISSVMDTKQKSRKEVTSPSKSTKLRIRHENGFKDSKQRARTGIGEQTKTVTRPPFDNSTRVIRNNNEFSTSEINIKGTHASDDTDIEVQDWVVKKLNLSNSKLTEKDLDRISVLVTVYCNVSINIKKVLAKYKKEDILKLSKKERTSKRAAVSKRRDLYKESTEENEQVPQYSRESTSGDETPQAESSETSETASTPEQDSPTSPDSDHGTPTQSEPTPSTSTNKTGAPEMINDYEPTPGCSKDPDTPPRTPTRTRPQSEPLPGTMNHVRFEPLPSTSKQADEQEQKTQPPKKPRRKVRLTPALPDMMNEPPRGVAISTLAEEEEEEEVPGKVKVDADMMEVALIILLATKRRKKELQALMASY